ncbi:MAG: single-stranded-DNA-specific exonuclease RecJ [Planctomycetota bacterium]
MALPLGSKVAGDPSDSPTPASPEPADGTGAPAAGGAARASGRAPVRWRLLGAGDAAAAESRARLVTQERLPEVVARLLVGRGARSIEAAQDMLSHDLNRLHDPLALPSMEAAVQRVVRALEQREVILVHGDYDVDGITGTAILVRLLRHLGARVDWHVPHRIDDGYSFGPHSVTKARSVGATLVISVDNGTSAGETIAALYEHGIETIVTDHHEPPQGAGAPPLPGPESGAVAIVNPKLPGSEYPFRELCGSAVAFKLAWALCQRLTGAQRVRDDLRQFLFDSMGYVALATICDVVPLVGENRLLTHHGLRALAQRPTPGVRALLDLAGLAGRALSSEDISFQIGPRINASGRMDSAARALEVLLATEDHEARRAAAVLDELNQTRRRVEREVLQQALAEAARFEDADAWPMLVLAGQGWHQGVVGIVAGRLAERFDRPALVIGLNGEVGRGSARSARGLDVLELMRGGDAEMERWGGHAQAAGCDVRADRIDALRDAIAAHARGVLAQNPPGPRELVLDAELCLASLDEVLMRQIDRLEPFGERNRKPLLLARDVRIDEAPRVVGADGTHLMLRLRRGARTFKAMAFGLAHRAGELDFGRPLHLAYTPRWNTFRGTTNLELVVHDFQTSALVLTAE